MIHDALNSLGSLNEAERRVLSFLKERKRRRSSIG